MTSLKSCKIPQRPTSAGLGSRAQLVYSAEWHTSDGHINTIKAVNTQQTNHALRTRNSK